jgi:hypothetical protein
LEGCRVSSNFNALSDKSARLRPFELKQLVGAVRMADVVQRDDGKYQIGTRCDAQAPPETRYPTTGVDGRIVVRLCNQDRQIEAEGD